MAWYLRGFARGEKGGKMSSERRVTTIPDFFRMAMEFNASRSSCLARVNG
jgi:hypothetical protein